MVGVLCKSSVLHWRMYLRTEFKSNSKCNFCTNSVQVFRSHSITITAATFPVVLCCIMQQLVSTSDNAIHDNGLQIIAKYGHVTYKIGGDKTPTWAAPNLSQVTSMGANALNKRKKKQHGKKIMPINFGLSPVQRWETAYSFRRSRSEPSANE